MGAALTTADAGAVVEPGDVVVVTGGTGGVGMQAALVFAAQGADVVVTGRDADAGEAARADIARLTGNSKVRFVRADASLVADNVRLAETLRDALAVDRVDVLVNNAGGLSAPRRQETREGVETTLAPNVVAPYVLFMELLPLLRRSRHPRVVNVVSSAFAMHRDDPFRDPQWRAETYVAFHALARAKRLEVLVTLALAREHPDVPVNAVNPGMMWTRNVADMTRESMPAWRAAWPLARAFQRAMSSPAGVGLAVASAARPGAGTARYWDGRALVRLDAAEFGVDQQDRAEAVVADALRGMWWDRAR